MSYGTLLSSAGTQALQTFQSNQSNMYYLGTVATENSYTKQTNGFDNKSIFANSSGVDSSYSGNGALSGNFNTSYASNPYRGSDGLNRRGAISYYDTRGCSIPRSVNEYQNGVYGSSLMGNYLTSIQSVALGQYAPTSVFEQRLNYHLDYADQRKPGSMLGNYSNYFDTESVANNKSQTSNYNVYSTSSAKSNSFGSLTASNNLSKAASANSVSDMMSIFGTVNTGSMKLDSTSMKAKSANNVSSLMSLMA